MTPKSESEYVVTMQVRVVVADLEALLAAAAERSPPASAGAPRDMLIRMALEALVLPPDVDDLPGARAPT